MIVVKLMGGLGNQMFQYAFGKRLADRHCTELKFDLAFLLDRTPVANPHFVFRDYDLDIFALDVPTATPAEVKALRDRSSSALLNKLLNKVLGPKKSYIPEEQFHVSQCYLDAPADAYLEGYWQSPNYFPETAGKLFTFRNPLSPESTTLQQKIKSTRSVCVNVRRGDFVSSPVHGTMGTAYYTGGERLLNERFDDLHYFVFSDDIPWCEQNLRFSRPVTFVSHDFAGRKFGEYLQLMIACDHFLIPNSSFAWWAAWLSENREKVVIAPKKWFNDGQVNTSDLIPETWIRL